MHTKEITKLPASYRRERIKNVICNMVNIWEKELAGLCKMLVNHFDEGKWIRLTRQTDPSQSVYYVHDIVGLLTDLNNWDLPYQDGNKEFNKEILKNLSVGGFSGNILTELEVKKCFNDNVKMFRDSSSGDIQWQSQVAGVTFKKGEGFFYYITNNEKKYQTYPYGAGVSWLIVTIPVHRFRGENSAPVSAAQAVLFWLEQGLQPDDASLSISEQQRNAYNVFQGFEVEDKELIQVVGESISLDTTKICEAIFKGSLDYSFLPPEDIRAVDIASGMIAEQEITDSIKRDLLECDHQRAQLDVYDPKLLTDPNRGHWDLWDLPEKEEADGLRLTEKLTARDPHLDINRSGIVGIDFGTKSTVVAYEDRRGRILPLQVGNGDYGDLAAPDVNENPFENPTVIEFAHIDAFQTAYKAREGRPRTRWEDIRVSHEAANRLKRSQQSTLYNSFLENIKLWCGDTQSVRKLKDQDGKEFELHPFLDLTEKDPNPLEIYAYYLGCYINHMFQPQHIYMNYILSFPVMYEKQLRDRMQCCFERGLKKSLPTALLSDGELMKKSFRVIEGKSEPAAYAVTALKEYNMMEKPKETYYAVFDFGGGTTDFDFGVLKAADGPDADRYNVVVKHFGAFGDRTLGGENLLQLMAFEVFRYNLKRLLSPETSKSTGEPPPKGEGRRNGSLSIFARIFGMEEEYVESLSKGEGQQNGNGEKQTGDQRTPKQIVAGKAKIPFTLTADAPAFPESVGIIRDSQEAHLNMHNLAEALRPLWEDPEGEKAKKIMNEGKVTVDLFKDDGRPEYNYPLYLISNPESKESENKAQEDDHSEKMESTSTSEVMDDTEREPESNCTAIREVQKEKKAPGLDLQQLIHDRIDRGVENFFHSLRDAFDKCSGGKENGVAPLSDIKEIAIFLAGNSTRSKVVSEVFGEYIGKNGKAWDILGFDKINDKMCKFTLYPPLGTTAAREMQKKNGRILSKENPDVPPPTGKTGVAFGLLLSRPGREIKVEDITSDGKEASFQFYVGRRRKGKFFTVISCNEKLGQWHRFIDAREAEFDILYTTNASAAMNKMSEEEAERITIFLDKKDPEADVYIKAVNSKTIQYAVAKNKKDLEKTKEEPISIELD